MDKTKTANPNQQQSAPLVLKVRLTDAEKYERVRLPLECLRLKSSRGAVMQVSLESRRLELQAKLDFTDTIKLTVPSGSYGALRLIFGEVSGLPDRGVSWVQLASVAALSATEKIDLKPDSPATISIARDLAELLSDKALDDEREETIAHWHHVDLLRSTTIRLNQGTIRKGRRTWAEIQLLPGAFQPDTELHLHRGDADELPKLFKGQGALGPVLEISASSPPRGSFDITLDYSPAGLARSGFAPKQMVVLELLRDRRQYRELRPYHVDTVNHTVSVHADSLSAFFACSPGILIDFPELVIDAANQVIAYTDAHETQIAGRAVDDRAEVLLLTPRGRSGWTSQGWFVFEGVALQRSDTRVTLAAGVTGDLFEHFCDFTVRRALPVKTIARPNMMFAGTPGFGDEGTPFVATVLRQTADVSGVKGVDSMRGFLSGLERNTPTLFWFNADTDQWESFRLLSDRFYENEFSRLAIAEIRRNMQLDVPINANYPEDVRYLRSLADFVAAPRDANASLGLALIIGIAANTFNADQLSISPRLPIVTLDQGHIGCAYVAASYGGWQALARSSLDNFLRRRHVPRQTDRRSQFGLSVLAGRLFFVPASPDGVLATEVVAENMLCGALSMKFNPDSGQPAILAIGLSTEDGDGSQNGSLYLFQRQADGKWTRNVVWQDQLVIDADMDFGRGDRPSVVAAVENENEDLNANLYFLIPHADRPEWRAEPLVWNAPGFPADTTLGMWPRIDAGTLSCAFTFFAQDTVSWLVATTKSIHRWQAAEVGHATRVELVGASNLSPPQGFVDDVVGFSRVSAYHWAPSIAPAEAGSIWYAFGNGVLHLARVTSTFSSDFSIVDIRSSDSIVDIDRTTGFLPQLATRTFIPKSDAPPPPLLGTPVVTYKDMHGASTLNEVTGIELATGLDLHLFDLGTSHQVPRRDPPAPLASRHTFVRAFVRDFGERVPFTCARLTQYVDLVVSVLSNILGGGGASPAELQRFIDETQASIFMNSTLDIHARPQESLLEITIDNDHPNEPDAIVSMQIRQRGSQPATLTVTDSQGRAGDGACGGLLSQDGWNAIANNFLRAPIDPGSIFPPDPNVELHDVLLQGIRISFSASSPPVPQQGGIRFRVELPSIRVEGDSQDVGFTAVATEPSVFEFELAPFVVDGQVTWQIRSTSGKIGNIDVKVHLDALTWVGIIGAVLTFDPLFLTLVVVDPIANSFATAATNEQLAKRKGLPLGGLPDQLAGLLAAHALRKGFGTGADLSDLTFEAVLLEDWIVTYFLRTARGAEEGVRETNFSFLPERLRDFGSVIIGEESEIRRVVLVNNGHFPVSLDNLQVVGSNEFVIISPVAWPKIVVSGSSELIDLRFRPQGRPGFREAILRADYNQERQLQLTLSGIAQAAPVPNIYVIPRQLNFGVVNVRTTSTLQLTVGNDGAAPLTINAMHIQGPDSALFALPGQVPSAIQAGQSAVVDVSFTPAAMVAGGHRATLVIESNANNQPQLSVSLFGVGAASNILVMPPQIAFNDSVLAAKLPPGLGSRRSFTIYNVGVAALTIAGSSFQVLNAGTGQASPDYQLLDSNGQAFPQNDVQLRSGEFLSLSVQFRPITAGDHPARIDIRSTDLTQPSVMVSISGRGIG